MIGWASPKPVYRYPSTVAHGLEHGRLRYVTIKTQSTRPLKPDREALVTDLRPLTYAQVQHLKTVYAALEAVVLDRILRTGIKSN
jgi:hypothetical protein